MTSERSPDRLDRVALALGDPTRRRLMERLSERPGQTSGELAAGVRALSRWAVLKHLSVLRDARLVEMLPQGRKRRHYLNRAGLGELAEWLESVRSEGRESG